MSTTVSTTEKSPVNSGMQATTMVNTIDRMFLRAAKILTFDGEQCFLTDARLHRGMSGSPVISRIPAQLDVAGKLEHEWRLLGIHSSALDVSDRDPDEDERFGLNMTWYASLIPGMLPARAARRRLSKQWF